MSAVSLGDSRKVDLLPVIANRGDDLQRQGKGAPPILEGNFRSGPLSYGPQERRELGVQRFLCRDRWLGHSDLRIRRRKTGMFSVLTHGEDQHFLPPVVE